MKQCIRWAVLVLFNLGSVAAFAATDTEIDGFIERLELKSFDCPSADIANQARQYLEADTLTANQRFSLQVASTHGLICMGKYDEALTILLAMVEDARLEELPHAYASAIYQIGFIYDVKEDKRRCGYYRQAENLATGRFNDIALSAQLGQLTVCQNDLSDGVKLGKMYELLKHYTQIGDQPSVAHIHNNIGLLYGTLGQQVLAAEQYLKAYQIGLSHYTSSNQLATLISAVSAQMASGDFTAAENSIEEFRRANKRINTPLSNNWLHFAESGYYYRTENFEALRDSLMRWQIYLPKMQSHQFDGFYRWYEAALCHHDRDIACLEKFLAAEEAASPQYKAMVTRNKDYLRLMVEINLLLGDVSTAQAQFAKFADVMLARHMKQQGSGKVLGIAQLHNQILQLESDLDKTEQQNWSLLKLFLLLSIVLIIVFYLIRKRYAHNLSEDPLTGLKNARTAVGQIKKADKPSQGRVNAVALFDVENFREVNSQFGFMAGDIALKRIAQTLLSITREKDIVGRLSSEQFIVCLTDIEEQSATHFFERIQSALESTNLHVNGSQRINIQSSMSIYISQDGLADLDEVLGDMQRSLSKSFNPVHTAG